MAVARGVNHFDVAPSYGDAELRLGPWMERNHKKIFLACKIRPGQSGRLGKPEKVAGEIKSRLFRPFPIPRRRRSGNVERHSQSGWRPRSSTRSQAARTGTLYRDTGHRPFTHCEALNRFDFDTVLFPLNRGLAAHSNDYNDFKPLLELVKQKDVGTIAIKSVTKRPWESPMHHYQTWYEPFDSPADIEKGLWYTLSQGVTTAAMAGAPGTCGP